MIRYLPFLLGLALFVFALVDLITIDGSRVRHLPKGLWITLLFIPFIGPLAWLLVGREPLEQRNHGRYNDPPESSRPIRPRTVTARVVDRGPLAPDDDPEFLARLRREHEQEQRIRQLEQRLAEVDERPAGGPDAADGSGGTTGTGSAAADPSADDQTPPGAAEGGRAE